MAAIEHPADGTMSPPVSNDEAAVLIDYWGGLAYDAYFRHCGGKSIHGEDLPAWENQEPAIRAHWFAAAKAVKLATGAQSQATDAPSDEDRIRSAMAEAQDHPGRVVTR